MSATISEAELKLTTHCIHRETTVSAIIALKWKLSKWYSWLCPLAQHFLFTA